MDEILLHIVLIVIAFLLITLGAHFIFGLVWVASMLVALAVIVFVYLGIWIND